MLEYMKPLTVLIVQYMSCHCWEIFGKLVSLLTPPPHLKLLLDSLMGFLTYIYLGLHFQKQLYRYFEETVNQKACSVI